jgi:hypothetical protein
MKKNTWTITYICEVSDYLKFYTGVTKEEALKLYLENSPDQEIIDTEHGPVITVTKVY